MKSLQHPLTAGVDVDSRFLHLAIRKEGRYVRRRFDNTDQGCLELARKLLDHQVDRVVFEATGNYTRRLARALRESQIGWAELNPRHVRDLAKGLGQLHKTDKADAELLADLAFMLQPKPTTPRNPLHLELRDLSRQIAKLTQDKANLKKRLRVPLRAEAAVESDRRYLEFLKQEIARLERQWLELLQSEPELRQRYVLALSVPSVGPKTARVLVSELPPDLGPYRVKQLVAYCGPAPRDNASGTRIGPSWVPHTGNSYLHKALHMPALSSIRRRPDLRALYLRLVGQGKHHLRALTAVARQLASEAMAVLKRGSPWLATAPRLDMA